MIVMESFTLQASLVPAYRPPSCRRIYSDLMLFKDFLMTTHNVNTTTDTVRTSRFSSLLIGIFIDEDNALVECLLFCLEFYANFNEPRINFLTFALHPDIMFYEFLRATGHDYEVLLDFLVNDETSFLLYIIKYLRLKMYLGGLHSLATEACESGLKRQDIGRKIGERKVGSGEKVDVSCRSDSVLSEEICEHSCDVTDVQSKRSDSEYSDSDHVSDEMLRSINSVLKKLCSRVVRLHKAKLFPYNPEPLLKLLTALNL